MADCPRYYRNDREDWQAPTLQHIIRVDSPDGYISWLRNDLSTFLVSTMWKEEVFAGPDSRLDGWYRFYPRINFRNIFRQWKTPSRQQ